MQKAVVKALNPYGKSADEYNQILEVCCAVIRKYYIDEARINGKEEEMPVRTDLECKDISYLCGRALAVMNFIEDKAKPENEKKRETNAMRYMVNFHVIRNPH